MLYFSPYSCLQHHLFLVSWNWGLEGGFFNRGLGELFCRAPMLSSLCSSSCSILVSLQEKRYIRELDVWETGKGGKRMPRHLVFIFPYFSFQTLFLLLSFRQWLFQCENHHGKGNGASLLRIQPMTRLVDPFYPLFIDFDSISGVLRSSCSILFEHDLALSSRALSVRRLQLSFRRWFGIIDIRVTYPLYGYNFNPRAYTSYAIHIFKSRFR